MQTGRSDGEPAIAAHAFCPGLPSCYRPGDAIFSPRFPISRTIYPHFDGNREMIAKPAFTRMFGVAEAPRLMTLRSRLHQSFACGPDRIDIATPSFVVQHARRHTNMVINQQMPAVIDRPEF